MLFDQKAFCLIVLIPLLSKHPFLAWLQYNLQTLPGNKLLKIGMV